MIRKIDSRADHWYLVVSSVFITLSVYYPLVASDDSLLAWAVDTANKYVYMLVLNMLVSYVIVNSRIRVFANIVNVFILIMAIYEVSYIYDQERSNVFWHLFIGLYWIVISPIIYFLYVSSKKHKR